MIKNILLILGVTLLGACSTPTEEKAEQVDFDPSILDNKILNANGELNLAMADSAVKLYMKSYKLSQEDSIAPYQLMKAADIQRNIPGKALMAIKKYNTIKEEYPDHELAAPAYFMMGMTFDENLKSRERAAKVYEEFIRLYPDHKLVTQAQGLLALASDTSSSDLDKVREWSNN